MKKLLIFCLLAATTQITVGQVSLTPVSDWTTVAQEQGVQLSYVYQDCEIPEEGFYAEYIYLSFKNTNNYPVTVSWFNDTYYNGKCTNCDHKSRDRKRQINLAAGETLSGQCQIGLNRGLRIHRKWLQMKGRTLQKLELTELNVQSEIEK